MTHNVSSDSVEVAFAVGVLTLWAGQRFLEIPRGVTTGRRLYAGLACYVAMALVAFYGLLILVHGLLEGRLARLGWIITVDGAPSDRGLPSLVALSVLIAVTFVSRTSRVGRWLAGVPYLRQRLAADVYRAIYKGKETDPEPTTALGIWNRTTAMVAKMRASSREGPFTAFVRHETETQRALLARYEALSARALGVLDLLEAHSNYATKSASKKSPRALLGAALRRDVFATDLDLARELATEVENDFRRSCTRLLVDVSDFFGRAALACSWNITEAHKTLDTELGLKLRAPKPYNLPTILLLVFAIISTFILSGLVYGANPPTPGEGQPEPPLLGKLGMVSLIFTFAVYFGVKLHRSFLWTALATVACGVALDITLHTLMLNSLDLALSNLRQKYPWHALALVIALMTQHQVAARFKGGPTTRFREAMAHGGMLIVTGALVYRWLDNNVASFHLKHVHQPDYFFIALGICFFVGAAVGAIVPKWRIDYARYLAEEERLDALPSYEGL
jgi:hypothetical protein